LNSDTKYYVWCDAIDTNNADKKYQNLYRMTDSQRFSFKTAIAYPLVCVRTCWAVRNGKLKTSLSLFAMCAAADLRVHHRKYE
jgi:hypothetical protein